MRCFKGFKAGAALLLVLPWSGCNPKTESRVERPIIATDSAMFNKPPSSFQDTLVLSSESAVFFNSDSIQLKKFKDANSEMIFKSTTHDCIYQQKNARKVLHEYWIKIVVRDATNYRYLMFVRKNRNPVVVDLNPLDLCGLFLFEPGKEPVQADMMNIETALGNYFKSN